MIKSRRLLGQVMWYAWGRRGMHVETWLESQKERDPWEDLDVGGRMTLKWILERQDWTDLAQDRDQWRTCEPLGSIKCYEVLE
jgi:hypothetical protein